MGWHAPWVWLERRVGTMLQAITNPQGRGLGYTQEGVLVMLTHAVYGVLRSSGRLLAAGGTTRGAR